MEDLDITRLRKVLRHKGRRDLAELLTYSTSQLNETSTYGSRWYSVISSFEIKSPPEIHEKISNLSEEDKKEIFEALLLVYPLKDNEPEITSIEYFPDFDLESISLIETDHLENISFEYLHEQLKKCKVKIEEKDYEGAITNARTLVESVCLFILENINKEKYKYNGNLIKLYKETANKLSILPSISGNENIKQITSGLISIVNGISGLRNTFSDSHGTSPSNEKYKVDMKLATLTVNLAKTITEYLYLCFENK